MLLRKCGQESTTERSSSKDWIWKCYEKYGLKKLVGNEFVDKRARISCCDWILVRH